ncbi:hypothetical protein BAUCODRAFT_121208 [Baudoinia panamericana UAMH 10762]|uniref:Xylose isomerase-like TIM barrel domain-containing protein n=1 Tax=Baudoinia panamericana (strain UAMH 10762) TaxID=717646 RepID=M2N300_BAUPA|nr:uncharacterized protein BAUCODRAFT_121208 [Baudoinia panamericana UAMH 10762]EMC98333.1 hypothetical protein BAUCODRAFT_121208 [Baudoinia panamericana UAMH 10762]
MPCRPAISSHSLGRAWVHSMPSKLDQAAKHGFDIELFYEDLEYVAKSYPGGVTATNLLLAAQTVRSLCVERGIAIVCLQPFMHYEGLRDRQCHAQRVKEMHLWIQLAHVLNTHIISIPSSFLPVDQASGDLKLIISDLRKVADLGAPEGIQFAYESLAWGTYSDTWEQSWKIVQLVDRPNFGLCLDTFNMAARIYADPTAPHRRTPNAEAATKASVDRLVRTVDVSKIVYVQVVDAEYLTQPLIEGHEYYEAGQPARMSWSRNCRLFYGEQERGAYLPVRAILKAILVDLGFEGWVSAEMFNRTLAEPSPAVPGEHARRAAVAWQKVVVDCKLESCVAQRPEQACMAVERRALL